MIHALRHMAVRLWITLLVGSMVIFLALPVAPLHLDLGWIWALTAVVLLLVFLSTGWLFNRWALALVERLVREAAIWERAGNFIRAESTFRKAVALFDSFLISPASKKENSRHLMARLARFFLARQEEDVHADLFIAAYLHTDPADTVVAEAWLQRALLLPELTPDQQELIFRIGEAQSDNIKIQSSLVRHYLATERIDFQALQSYCRILESEQARDSDLIFKLAMLFHAHRRTDEWALRAYVMSYETDPARQNLLQGMAACLQRLDSGTLPRDLLQRALGCLSAIKAGERKAMAEGFSPPAAAPAAVPARPKVDRVKQTRQALQTAARAIDGLGRKAAGVARTCTETLQTLFHKIRSFPNLKTVLKWSGIAVAGVALAVLAVNTASFLLKPKQESLEKEIQTAPVVTDPFTLQVAAYLKKEHAEHYVHQLTAKGLDAYWTEAKGAQTQWYQVRLSHFADKAAALAYGESLKAKGIIDDFYVANYQRP